MQVASGVFLAPNGLVAPVNGALDKVQHGVDPLHPRIPSRLSTRLRGHSLRSEPKIVKRMKSTQPVAVNADIGQARSRPTLDFVLVKACDRIGHGPMSAALAIGQDHDDERLLSGCPAASHALVTLAAKIGVVNLDQPTQLTPSFLTRDIASMILRFIHQAVRWQTPKWRVSPSPTTLVLEPWSWTE